MVEEQGQFLAGELHFLNLFGSAVHPYQADAHEDGRNKGDDVIN